MKKQTFTVNETASLLGLSRGSVYQGVMTGEIPSIRIGGRILVPKAALEKLLSGAGNVGKAPVKG